MTAAVESVSKGRATRARAAVKRAQLTVGDLIAAAYDVLGSEARVVAKVLSSPDLAVAIHRRIVVV
ncbi:MAG TPA: hypothetical protein VND93_21870 [Myxococcales bacterium]|nr:hypothetical protein [Myxococcales bacterium]